MTKTREEQVMSDEHLRYAVEILTQAFERELREKIGVLKQYPDTELVAWKNALNSVATEIQAICDQPYYL
ncbi:hypothetical protein [Halotia branconii]|uniref:Uncharacterized protein n=1 Tax=Halotia branconii CENA392 TaxID=1539056 RepID=A0AAJ6NNH5_9CYAN|nr:hypothetical protein [Halotia branconii]WGV23687.1 hypothetical protein QI031_17940 [Halotia branconii CENA392]